MADAFISYSSKDKATADVLVAEIERRGLNCWVAPRDIQPGREWAEAILDGISNARGLVLLFSAHANASPHVRREVERAVHKQIPIITLRLQTIPPTGSMEFLLSAVHWLDAQGQLDDSHFRAVVAAVRGISTAHQSLAAPCTVRLEVTGGPERGRSFNFDSPDCFLFGRANDARVSLPRDPYVSRQHFLLEVSPPRVKVVDLGSKNGVMVNGVLYGGRRSPAPGVQQARGGAREAFLTHGAEITVGDTVMRVEINGAAPAPSMAGETPLLATTAEETLSRMPAATNLTLSRAPTRSTVCSPFALDEPSRGTLLGRYWVEAELGRGGMGVIYRGHDQETGKTVAIKTLLPEVATNPATVHMFLRDVDIGCQLRHPNIVALLDHGRIDETFFFIMEFVDGGDLAGFLARKGGRLTIAEAAPLMLGILDGLAYAHRADLQLKTVDGSTSRVKGVVHRDLKPESILITGGAGRQVPKIADFGLAKGFQSAGLTDMTKPGVVGGTPLYWAREQITHYRHLTPATDVFSIAAVFYQMLTGQLIRDGFTELDRQAQQGRPLSLADYLTVFAKSPPIPMRQRDPTLPESVAQCIDRALREEEVMLDAQSMQHLGQLRYADAGEMRDALARALGSPDLPPRAADPLKL